MQRVYLSRGWTRLFGYEESSMKQIILLEWMQNIQKPLLGICLGMQLLFEKSEEGSSKGIGVIPGKLKKFNSDLGKVPHMGWNTFTDIKEHDLLRGISKEDYFYYVHSYYAPVNEFTLATCDYINRFASVVARNNFLGVQFHPEKSGGVWRTVIIQLTYHSQKGVFGRCLTHLIYP